MGGLAAKGLDPRERLAGLAGAVLAAVGFAAIWLPHLGQPTPKGHQAAALYLGIGLIEALVLAVCTLARRRYLVGFASLVIAFGPWNAYSVLVVPFLALAGWTIFRASRLSRREAAISRPVQARRQGSLRSTRSANRRAAGAAGGGETAASGRTKGAVRRSSRVRSGGRGRGDQEAVDATGRRRPGASKRYTPPKSAPRRGANSAPKSTPKS